MSEGERIKLVIDFTDFINSNLDFVKNIYKLFENGECTFEGKKNKAILKIANLNKEKIKDVFTTALLFTYINMKQLQSPNNSEVEIREEEFAEVLTYCDYLKENNKDLLKILKGEDKE